MNGLIEDNPEEDRSKSMKNYTPLQKKNSRVSSGCRAVAPFLS